MGKRKLNRRQQWRIQKVQDEKVRRAQLQRQKIAGDYEIIEATLFQGQVVSHYGATLDIELIDAKAREPLAQSRQPLAQARQSLANKPGQTIIRCALRQNIDNIVCGDYVVWQKVHTQNNLQENIQGVVTALQARQSVLARPDFNAQMKPVAANIDQILIITSPLPEFNEGMVDRYLVAAELSRIPAVLVLNKIDTLDNDKLEDLKSRVRIYHDIGYQILFTSAVTSHGLDPLYQQLDGKTSVFVGQSGVGKSSLINSLLPDARAKTADLSEATNKGRHTTSVSKLYRLSTTRINHASLIDSPGVREFGLWDIAKEQVIDGFIDCRKYAGHCKFRDCKHLNEPGCGLLTAVNNGYISQQRLDSYHRIVASLD